MLASKDNWADVKKYYQGTFVKLHSSVLPEVSTRIWKIKDVNSERILVNDVAGEEVYIDLNRPYNLDYIIPKKTVYQYGERACFLSRVPARMWKKGMSSQNTEMLILDGDSRWRKIPLEMSLIDGFINKPGYFTFEEARQQFTGGTSLVSAALSPRISISRNYLLFIDLVNVGRYKDGVLTIKEIFVPDVEEIFSGSKIKVL